MNGASQPGGRSPKLLNSPSSATQIKPTSDSVQILSQVKRKKRERLDQVSDPSKQERLQKPDDEDSGQSRCEPMLQSEIAKITDKGGLVDFEGVKKLVQLMQLVSANRKIDLSGRLMLVDVISATDRSDCLGWFIQHRGLPVLDDWIQEIHKRRVGYGNNSKEGDKSVEDYLCALLRALDNLPVNLDALQTCHIGKSVNCLRTHKSADVRKKARSLVDTWKRRVEIEISMNDAKSGPSRGVSWPAKPVPSEGSQVGNKKSDSSIDTGYRNSVLQSYATKSSQAKLGAEECKFLAAPVSETSIAMSSVSSSKDTICGKLVATGNPELPLTTVKEERSSTSSQSQNNSHSFSSDHAKTVGSCKEDAKSSTTGSASKNTGSASPEPKSSNGLSTVAVSGVQKETGSLQVFPMHKNSSDKSSPTSIPQERFPEVPAVDYENSQRLTVKLPNAGCSPSRGVDGRYSEDTSLGSGKSSPAANHENFDRSLRARKQTVLRADASLNSDTRYGEDGLGGCDGGNVLIACDDKAKAVEDGKKTIEASRGACSLLAMPHSLEKLYNSKISMNALVESCVKFSEASTSSSPEDDVGMNLLASVAAGEILRSDDISSLASHHRHSVLACETFSMTDGGLKYTGQEVAQLASQTNGGVSNDQTGTSVLSLEKKEECGSVLDVSLKTREQTAEVDSLRSDLIPGEVICDSSIKASALKNEIDPEVNGANNFNENGHAVLGWDKYGSSPDSKVKVRSPMPEGDKKHVDMSERAVDTSASSEPVSGSGKVVEEVIETMIQSLSEMDVSSPHDTVKILGGSDDKEKPSPSDAFQPDYSVRENGDTGLLPFATSDRSHMESTDKAAVEIAGEDHAGKGKAKIGLDSSFSHRNTGTEDNSVREEGLFAASSNIYLSAATVQENETSTSSSGSKLERKDCDGVDEELVMNGKASASNMGPSCSVKLDFDLNEGFPLDDGSHGEDSKHVPFGLSSTVHLPCTWPISAPSTSVSFSTSITVASAGKGYFVPPENPLRGKGEPGWKGSAATSAFRPAEPRRTLDVVGNACETPSIGNAFGRQSRPILDFDLNVADEHALEDVTSLSSAQASCPESGNNDHCSSGLDLDLNRVDNPDAVPVSGSNGSRSEVSVVPRKTSLAGGLAKISSNASRGFDLNNGPGIDELGAEIASCSQPIKSSMASLSSINNVRLNSGEFRNFSSWFPPTYSSDISVPSMFPGRGEQNYMAATGSHRILAPPSSCPPFGLEMCRPPVLPSSPAVPFPSATPFPYSGFHFGTSFPPSSSFSSSSTVYVDSAKGGPLCFPAIPSQLVGPSGVMTSMYSRPLNTNLPGVANSVGADNGKWGSQIDLNSGPRGNVSDRRDDRLTSSMRWHITSSPQLADEYLRAYQLPGGVATVGGVFKRKEPEGGWDSTDGFSYNQSSSQ